MEHWTVNYTGTQIIIIMVSYLLFIKNFGDNYNYCSSLDPIKTSFILKKLSQPIKKSLSCTFSFTIRRKFKFHTKYAIF